MAELPGGEIVMRDSKHPAQGTLTFSRQQISALLFGAKAGEFDDMA
jgi:hypothetical protein